MRGSAQRPCHRLACDSAGSAASRVERRAPTALRAAAVRGPCAPIAATETKSRAAQHLQFHKEISMRS